ncbi:Uncharacterized protein HZ326_16482 [Fusarium oxysporum f. sp. albedinis]|nr:hypothetical protein HZ326_27648 [Fusarium oxysporum f. sp. albedinis]KAJ0140643.1 Uncharacterized protein HZ326_16482 [Fusarium oxysporum f. sp. albedinis]
MNSVCVDGMHSTMYWDAYFSLLFSQILLRTKSSYFRTSLWSRLGYRPAQALGSLAHFWSRSRCYGAGRDTVRSKPSSHWFYTKKND